MDSTQSEVIPFRGRIDYCFAAKDGDQASTILTQITGAMLDLDVYPEVASQQPMDKADVTPESPLHKELHAHAAMLSALATIGEKKEQTSTKR